MSKSLDPDQARQEVGPDLRSKCLQKLPAEVSNGLNPDQDDKIYDMSSLGNINFLPPG